MQSSGEFSAPWQHNQDHSTERFPPTRQGSGAAWPGAAHFHAEAAHFNAEKEMRQAVLHLAFAGLGARQADSGAFFDNHASNRVSQALGYQPNGVDWATRHGDAAEINRWRLTREQWSMRRRADIELVGVAECLPVLGIPRPA